MTYLKNTFFVITLLIVCLCSPSALAQPKDNVLVTLIGLDPGVESTLGNEDMLYVLVRYESDIPLRFQAIAMRDGAVLDVGSIKNPAALHSVGTGEALVWVGYTNPTHIDAVQVTVLDEKWRKLYKLTEEADVTWQGVVAAEPRKPAAWVKSLIKTERRKMDFVYDPSPIKYETLFDIVFFSDDCIDTGLYFAAIAYVVALSVPLERAGSYPAVSLHDCRFLYSRRTRY